MLLGLRAMVGAVVEQVTIAKPALDLRLALSGGLFFSVFCDQTNVDDDEPNYALHTQERIYVVGPRGRVCCETPTEEPPRW